MSDLSEAPAEPLDAEGRPKTGTYRGSCETTDLDAASKRLGGSAGQRWFREKKWQWFSAATPQVAVGGTLFDAGYATLMFAWAFDRTARRMIADRSEILPPLGVVVDDDPGADTVAWVRGPARRFEITRSRETLGIDVSLDAIRMDLEIEVGASETLTAICPVGDGDERGVNVTQKENCLPVRGRVSAEGRSFSFGDDAVGMLDYTHGLLERETEWRWAIAAGGLDPGGRVGFNVSQGFNGDLENVVWLDGELQTTEGVEIDFDEGRGDSWEARTEEGELDVGLFVEGTRRHETDFRVVSSRYVQPIGRWHGRVVDREVHDLFGVGEHHVAKW